MGAFLLNLPFSSSITPKYNNNRSKTPHFQTTVHIILIIMHCLFYIACFFLALQAALAVPTLAPRAEQSADAKGQSDQKCWFGCGGWGLGYGYGGMGGGLYGFGGLYGGMGLYGSALLNPYYSIYTPGWGLWKKDAAAPNQNSSVCLSPLVSLANNHTRYSPSSRVSSCTGMSLPL